MEKGWGFVLVLWMALVVGVGAKVAEEETVTSAAPNSYWEELRKLLNTVSAYLFPPKIDFRPGKPVEDGVNGNMKEALTKSFETTKQIVEDSAKAAAETLQQQPEPPQPHTEL